MKLVGAILFTAVTTSVALAEEYDFDGALEAGDRQNETGGYADAYSFGANAGDKFHFAITEMDGVIPHGTVLDANGKVVYTTWGVTGELELNWEAEESGTYSFLVTQDYKAATPYHLKISN